MFTQLPAVLFLLFSLWLSMGGTIHAATIQLPQTGQTTCYDTLGAVIACAGTGQDGDKQAGVPWPDPRFTDNNNGTVTDNLTGLIWLKHANCFLIQDWATAITSANNLASGACGLSDGSTAGQWRLPNRKELQSLVDRSRYISALPSGHPFSFVAPGSYLSSSTNAGNTNCAWAMQISNGLVFSSNKETQQHHVWPVRAGQ